MEHDEAAAAAAAPIKKARTFELERSLASASPSQSQSHAETLRRSRSDGYALAPRRAAVSPFAAITAPTPIPVSREAEDVSALVLASMWSTWEQRCARYRERLCAGARSAAAETLSLASQAAAVARQASGAHLTPTPTPMSASLMQSELHAHNASACARIVAHVAAFAARYPHVEAYSSAPVLVLVSGAGRVLDVSVHVCPSLLHVHAAEPGLLSDDVFEAWYHSNELAARALAASESPTLHAALACIDARFLPSRRDSDVDITLCEVHVHASSNGGTAHLHLADTSPYAFTLSPAQRDALSPFVLGAHAGPARGVLSPSVVVLPAFAALLRAQWETRVIGAVAYKTRVKRLVSLASPYLYALAELGTSPEALGIRQLLLGNVLRD